jgi:plasmid maintenance system antidote protein VapI
MSIADLARALDIHQGNLSAVINGRRISPKTERRIAAFFGRAWEELFPARSRDELEKPREGAA